MKIRFLDYDKQKWFNVNMTDVKKKKKKNKRKLTPISKLLCLIVIGISSYGIWIGVNEILIYQNLKEELKEANTRYQEVKDENSYYTSEKEKLQDPDYIQSYARGNYMLSKDGEQIFYLPEKDN